MTAATGPVAHRIRAVANALPGVTPGWQWDLEDTGGGVLCLIGVTARVSAVGYRTGHVVIGDGGGNLGWDYYAPGGDGNPAASGEWPELTWRTPTAAIAAAVRDLVLPARYPGRGHGYNVAPDPEHPDEPPSPVCHNCGHVVARTELPDGCPDCRLGMAPGPQLPDDETLDKMAYAIWDLYQFSDSWADWDTATRAAAMRQAATDDEGETS